MAAWLENIWAWRLAWRKSKGENRRVKEGMRKIKRHQHIENERRRHGGGVKK